MNLSMTQNLFSFFEDGFFGFSRACGRGEVC